MVTLTGSDENRESFNYLLPEGHYDNRLISAIALLARRNDDVSHIKYVEATARLGAHLIVSHDLGDLPSAQFADALCHLTDDVTEAVNMALTRARQTAAGS